MGHNRKLPTPQQILFENDALLKNALNLLIDYESYLNLKSVSKKLNATIKITPERERAGITTFLTTKHQSIADNILQLKTQLKYIPVDLSRACLSIEPFLRTSGNLKDITKTTDLKQSGQQSFLSTAFNLAKRLLTDPTEVAKYFIINGPNNFFNLENLTTSFKLLLLRTLAIATNLGVVYKHQYDEFFQFTLIAYMLGIQMTKDAYNAIKSHQTTNNKLHFELHRLQFLLTRLSALELEATPSIARSPHRLLREPAPVVPLHTTDLSAHINRDYKDDTHLGRKPKRK